MAWRARTRLPRSWSAPGRCRWLPWLVTEISHWELFSDTLLISSLFPVVLMDVASSFLSQPLSGGRDVQYLDCVPLGGLVFRKEAIPELPCWVSVSRGDRQRGGHGPSSVTTSASWCGGCWVAHTVPEHGSVLHTEHLFAGTQGAWGAWFGLTSRGRNVVFWARGPMTPDGGHSGVYGGQYTEVGFLPFIIYIACYQTH